MPNEYMSDSHQYGLIGWDLGLMVKDEVLSCRLLVVSLMKLS